VIKIRNRTGVASPASVQTPAVGAKPVSAAATALHPEATAITPDGKNAYVTSGNKGALSQHAINPATGKITPLSPANVTIPPSGSLGLAITRAADLASK
jgi:hypothetical protein